MEPVSATRWMPAALDPTRELEDFDAVVRLHWPRVFRYALVSLRDRDAAETIAQDCFFKAYRARAAFRGDASVGTWLMQIAVNLVRDRARNRRLLFWKGVGPHPPDFDLPDMAASPEAGAVAKEQVAAVWTAAQTLPARQKTIFLLRFVEDMDLLEIAAVTGLSEGTVKTHLFRALHAVRERIGECK
jgi:RNA polymerase sigma-70 factor, ECF subfamily